jgi:translocation and assembly module TamB
MRRLVVVGTSQAGFNESEKSLNAQFENLNLLLQTKAQSPQDKDIAETSNAILVKGNIQGLTDWRWDINLRTEHLNLNQIIEDWPSDLTASLNARGTYESQKKSPSSNGVSLALSDINAQGELRGLAVSARGQVEYDGAYWSSSDANLAIGANQLVLKGKTGDELNLEWKIDAPLLGQIDPGIRGSINSNGSITGKKAEPLINIKGQISDFAWRDYAVNNLSLSLSPKMNTQDYDLLLNAAHAQLAGQYFSSITLKGYGTLEQHAIEAQVESPDLGGANFKLDSGWQNEIWRGTIKAVSLNVRKMSPWNLSSATQMQYNTQSAKKIS